MYLQDQVFPVAPPVFVGREHELAQLRQALRSPSQAGETGPGGDPDQLNRTPAVVLWGPGGIGKSVLAQAYAHTERRRLQLRWWISATGRLETIAGLAELAETLGVGVPDQRQAAQNALIRLGGRKDWLLVYDDADDQAVLAGLLPESGDGQVIITSRHSGWTGVTAHVRVGPLPEAPAVEYLRRSSGDSDQAAAESVAGDLDGSPLALALAAAYCRRSRTPLSAYHRSFVRERNKVLSDPEFAQRDYPTPVVIAWRRSLAAAKQRHKAAPDLLCVLSSFAPMPVAAELVFADVPALPRRLQRCLAEADGWTRAVHALSQLGLLTVVSGSRLLVHRLVAELTGALCPIDQRRACALGAVAALLGRFPLDVTDPTNWTACQALLPHVRAALVQASRVEVTGRVDAALRIRLADYLVERGESAHARDQLTLAVASREHDLGTDHPMTLAAVLSLVRVEQELGHYTTTRARLELMLPKFRKVLGEGHPDTLSASGRLADAQLHLGDLESAWKGYERIRRVCRDAYGWDHPSALIATHNLAGVARALDRPSHARRLYQEVFAGACEALGPDHPVTLAASNNLAIVLQELGRLEDARGYLEHNLDIRRRQFGMRHPAAVDAARNLALVLDQLGESARAAHLRTQQGVARVLSWRAHPDDCVSWLVDAATGHCSNTEIEGALAALKRSAHGRREFAAAFTWIIDGHREPGLVNGLDVEEAAIIQEALRRLTGPLSLPRAGASRPELSARRAAER